MDGNLGILIVTTRSDLSLRYFQMENVSVAYFEDAVPDFTEAITARPFAIVYLRDPFNTGRLALNDIAVRIDLVRKRLPGAYYVDRARSFQDVLIEDKWHQYERWGRWMPRTCLGGTDEDSEGQVIAKKRISARSRDIRFDVRPSAVSADWIVQERLTITEELRVHLLFGAPVTVAGIRRSKGPRQTTKMTGIRTLSEDEKSFVRTLAKEMREFDLLGLDLALTPSGLRLIEVNRSPQFKHYNELNGDNLVADFWPAIQKRLASSSQP